jgi:hypothetical protein
MAGDLLDVEVGRTRGELLQRATDVAARLAVELA